MATAPDNIDPAILAYAQSLNGQLPAAPPVTPAQQALAAGPGAVFAPGPGGYGQVQVGGYGVGATPGQVATPAAPPAPVTPPPGFGQPAGPGAGAPPAAGGGQWFQNPKAWNAPSTPAGPPKIETLPQTGGPSGPQTPDKLNIPGTYTTPARNIPLVDPKLQGGMPVDANGKPLDMQSAIGNVQATIGGQQTAQKALGTAEAGVHAAEAAGARTEASAESDAAKEIRERIPQHQAELKKYEDSYKNAIGQMTSQYHEDPNRLYNNMSTPQHIMWGLAAVIGGFYQGFTGRSNPAMDMMNKKVEQDIQAQRANYNAMSEGQRAKLTGAKDLYTIARENVDDDEKAYNLAMQMSLTATQHQAKALVADSQSPAAKAQADVVVSQLEQKKAEYDPLKVQEKMRENKYQQATSGGGIDMKKVYEQAKVYEKDAADHGRDISPQDAIRRAMIFYGYVTPGSQGYGPNISAQPHPQAGAGGAASSKERMAALDTAQQTLQAIIAQRQANGGGVLSPSQTATMGGGMATVRQSVGHALAGRISENDQKGLEGIFPTDPNAYSPLGSTDAQLQAGMDYINRARANLVNETGGGGAGAPTPSVNFQPATTR